LEDLVKSIARFIFAELSACSEAPKALCGQVRTPPPICGAEAFMAGSYSRDLRSRVLAAVEAGESVAETAKRFAVGRSTA
jgi:hypothetical protein